jgi:2-polyprenyl-3-methyl-5-hydroxy-6-metoxy-1,4-benzoquinol methylase
MIAKLDYTRHYKKWHSDTPQHIEGSKRFYQRLLSPFLPQEKNIQILDVGCGMGFTMLALQDLEYSVVEGIDIDDGQIKSCLDKGLDVTHVDDSANYLSKKLDTYDMIIALDVIEHLPHSEQLGFARAIQSAIKPGGKLICTVPNANSTLANRWRYIDWTHYISFTEHSLDFLLFNAGFDDIQVFEMEFFKPRLIALLRPSTLVQWLLFKTARAFRRFEMIAELGHVQGQSVPLSLNLLATAEKVK